jgi:hypothetical protein
VRSPSRGTLIRQSTTPNASGEWFSIFYIISVSWIVIFKILRKIHFSIFLFFKKI